MCLLSDTQLDQFHPTRGPFHLLFPLLLTGSLDLSVDVGLVFKIICFTSQFHNYVPT